VAAEAKRVLDVACGNGAVARQLPAHFVVGVDLSAAELAGAPRPVVRADATQLPFGNESYDAVTCSMGLAGFRIASASDADMLVRSLYLPATPFTRRVAAAAWLAERAAAKGPFEVAILIRRIVAMRARPAPAGTGPGHRG
jgi:SAM-dependent methyltransferase